MDTAPDAAQMPVSGLPTGTCTEEEVACGVWSHESNSIPDKIIPIRDRYNISESPFDRETLEVLFGYSVMIVVVIAGVSSLEYSISMVGYSRTARRWLPSVPL